MDNNLKLQSLLFAATDLLRVNNAWQVIERFCWSERIYQDFNLAFTQSEVNPSNWHENFVIRQWFDLRPELEFRGFVFNQRLVALSQYNHICYYEEIVQRKDHFFNLINESFNNVVKPRLQNYCPNYVVDFVIVEFKNEHKIVTSENVMVIEINPFLPSTDGALFSWNNDSAILEGKNDETIFRIRTVVELSVKALLTLEWRHIIDKDD
eukprot:TRINITY_DN304_c0_g2_i2.p1 TRINITY_DN304_c0_g2~~TRINITY_DN304_c0_g2_i2.p1  ORF type:complete len:209 (-),score=92.57 TRINITY_DN304_c0_g2_i2:147-773(-)